MQRTIIYLLLLAGVFIFCRGEMLGLLLIGALTVLGLACWGIWVLCQRYKVARYTLGVAIAGAVGALLITGAMGHPLYGKPWVEDNRPVLEAPEEVVKLEAPNILITKQGSRIAVRGMKMQPVEPPMDQFFLMQLAHGAGNAQALRVQADPRSPSGVVYERRFQYWCENTFFPCFHPKALPGYEKADLGGLIAEWVPSWKAADE